MHMMTVLVRECASQWDQATVMKRGAKRPRALAGGHISVFDAGVLKIRKLSTVGFYPICDGGLMEGSEGSWWVGVALEGVE